MIFINKKEIGSIKTPSLDNEGKKRFTIQTVYHAGYVIWQAIKSCFGSGWWVNEKPWMNNEGWKN
jgi:hypothetical protein